ncbi:TPA: ribulokinase, partial [Staphylococcus aureus]|nr:ribulokinase [Staphylococcus aureus]
MSYSIGIDYGTASGRVFLINTTNGQVVSKFVKPYTHGVIEGELNGLKIPHTYALQ